MVLQAWGTGRALRGRQGSPRPGSPGFEATALQARILPPLPLSTRRFCSFNERTLSFPGIQPSSTLRSSVHFGTQTPPLPPAALEVGVPACEDSGTFAADAGSAGTQIRAPKCPWSPRPSSPLLRGQCVPQTRSRGCPEQRQQAAGARETSPQGPLRSWGGTRAPRAEDPGAEGAFHASSASAALLQLPGCFGRLDYTSRDAPQQDRDCVRGQEGRGRRASRERGKSGTPGAATTG